jgi:hypothetical protein
MGLIKGLGVAVVIELVVIFLIWLGWVMLK